MAALCEQLALNYREDIRNPPYHIKISQANMLWLTRQDSITLAD
jgi:hypothetical protein